MEERKIKVFISPDVPPGTWTLGKQHPSIEKGIEPVLDGDERLVYALMYIGIIRSEIKKNPHQILYLLINNDDLNEGAWK